MVKIANNPLLMRANILGEIITAAGIIFLGAVLFVILRKQNEKMALTALGLYILEAVLLAASRMEAFSLLRHQPGICYRRKPGQFAVTWAAWHMESLCALNITWR